MTDGGFQALGLRIVENDHPEPVAWIVLVARSTDSVQDKVVIFTTAGDEHINSGNVLSRQPQLGPTPLLHGPHCPEIVHLGGDGHSQFDSNENPCGSEGYSLCSLGQDDACDTQTKIYPVDYNVGKGQEWSKTEHPSLPSLPDIDIVSVMDASYRTGLNPLLREHG